MPKIRIMDAVGPYFEALDSETSAGNRTYLHYKNPRARLLVILRKEGPQTVAKLLETSELLMSQFHSVYHDMVEKDLVRGPIFNDEIRLTKYGEELAQLQEES